MPLKIGNTLVQKYILDFDGNHILTDYHVNGFNVWHSGATDNSYFTFTLLEDDTYSIAAADPTNMPTELIIPSEYEGKPVTRVADYAFVDPYSTNYNQTIKRIVIPDSITTIGSYAFGVMLTVTEITWGANLVNIGENAFQYCVSLTSITIPDSVTFIGSGAFFGCSSLISVIIGDGVISIGSQAFRDCDNLRSVVIGNSVTSIGNYAFDNCPKLTNIVIPDSVTSIGEGAFYGCDSLTIYCEASSQPSDWASGWNYDNRPVVWGYNLIGDEYFTFTLLEDGTYSVKAADVSNLPNNIGIPFIYNGKAVTAIGDSAFMKASNITKVVVPNGVNNIGISAFLGCSNLASVTISNSVTRIDHNAFYNCTSLTSVNVPNSVRFIGYNAFGNCSSLTSIYLPDTITTFDSMGGYMSTFSGCSSLTEVRLPNGMTEIGANMFHSCVKLATITIPNTVTKIGDYAFKNNGLESIIIPLSVSTMGTQAFATDYYNQNLVIYCKASSKPTGWASDWNKAYSGYSSVVWGYTG